MKPFKLLLILTVCCLLTQCTKTEPTSPPVPTDPTESSLQAIVGTHILHGIRVVTHMSNAGNFPDTTFIDSAFLFIDAISPDSVMYKRFEDTAGIIIDSWPFNSLRKDTTNTDNSVYKYRSAGPGGVYEIQYNVQTDNITYYAGTFQTSKTDPYSIKTDIMLSKK